MAKIYIGFPVDEIAYGEVDICDEDMAELEKIDSDYEKYKFLLNQGYVDLAGDNIRAGGCFADLCEALLMEDKDGNQTYFR